MDKDFSPIKLTSSAIKRVKTLMERADSGVLGLRVGVTLSLIHI